MFLKKKDCSVFYSSYNFWVWQWTTVACALNHDIYLFVGLFKDKNNNLNYKTPVQWPGLSAPEFLRTHSADTRVACCCASSQFDEIAKDSRDQQKWVLVFFKFQELFLVKTATLRRTFFFLIIFFNIRTHTHCFSAIYYTPLFLSLCISG